MTYPSVSCANCADMMADDEYFEPDCPRCPIVFLNEGNELAVEVYSKLCSEVVGNGQLHALVIESYWEQILDCEGSLGNLIEKLDIMNEVAKKHSEQKEKAEAMQREWEAKQAESRKLKVIK